jgi:hypothetical protein
MKIRVMIGRAGMARIARRASRVPHIFDEVDLRAAPMRLRDALQRMKVEMMRLCVLPAPHRYEPETGRLAYPAKQLRQRVEAPSDSGSCVPRIWLMMPDNVRSGWGTTAFARSFMSCHCRPTPDSSRSTRAADHQIQVGRIVRPETSCMTAKAAQAMAIRVVARLTTPIMPCHRLMRGWRNLRALSAG